MMCKSELETIASACEEINITTNSKTSEDRKGCFILHNQ
jgi:hypothetical protein